MVEAVLEDGDVKNVNGIVKELALQETEAEGG